MKLKNSESKIAQVTKAPHGPRELGAIKFYVVFIQFRTFLHTTIRETSMPFSMA